MADYASKVWAKLWWHLFITCSPTWIPFYSQHWYPSQTFCFLVISQAGFFPTGATKSCWFTGTYTRYPQSRNILKTKIHTWFPTKKWNGSSRLNTLSAMRCVYMYIYVYIHTEGGVAAVKCPRLVSHFPKHHTTLVALHGLINLESTGCLRTEAAWKTLWPYKLRGLKCHLRLMEKPFPHRDAKHLSPARPWESS